MKSAEQQRTGKQAAIPSAIRRNLLLIASTQVASGIAFQLVPTLSAVMVVHLSGSTGLAGAAAGMVGVGRMLVAYFIGSYTDRYGRKPGLYLGIGWSTIGAILTGLSIPASSLPLFFVGITVFGFGSGAVQQLRIAAAEMLPASRRAEGIGLLLTGSLLGAFGGFALVGASDLLANPLGIESMALAWFLAPAILLPGAFFVTRVRPDPLEIASNLGRYYPDHKVDAGRSEVKENDGQSEGGFLSFARDYPTVTGFVAFFAVQGNMTMMMVMTSLLLREHGYDIPAISLCVTIHVIGMFAFSLPLGRLTDRLGRRFVMLFGVLTAASGSALVVLTPEYAVITFGLFLVGVGWSGVNVAAVALITDRVAPRRRGRALGVNDTFGGAASTAMPILAGPVAALFGLGSVGLLGVLLMVLPLVLLGRLGEPRPGQYRVLGAELPQSQTGSIS